MIIKFKIKEYNEISDKFIEVFDCLLPDKIEFGSEYYLYVSKYRIVIPQLQLSLRFGYCYDKCVDEERPAPVFVFYEENEKNVNRHYSVIECSINDAIADKCENMCVLKPEEIDCFIDTEEYIRK